MIYIVYGFVFGVVIPYIARRFNKFMPATLGYGIYKIIKPVKKTKKESDKKNNLLRKYLNRSLLMGVISAVVFYAFFLKFDGDGFFYKLLFIWLLILLAEIDLRMMLLPDIITFPLALIGVFASYLGYGFVDVFDSSFASLVGYFLPVIASLFLIYKGDDVFGGGDIKLLAVIGAWCGVSSLLYIIVLASITFGVYALLNKKKSGPFGPWIAFASFWVLMLF